MNDQGREQELREMYRAAERLEIELSFEFYNATLEKELERFYSAFLNKNHIFPENAIDEIPDTGEIDLEEAQRLSMMMAGMEEHSNGIFKGRFTAHAQPDFQGTLDGGRWILGADCDIEKWRKADHEETAAENAESDGPGYTANGVQG